MNDLNTRMLRNHLHAPSTVELGLFQLEMHADGGPHNLAFISLRVGKVAEHLQGGWVATGCHAHISLFARDERPYMGETGRNSATYANVSCLNTSYITDLSRLQNCKAWNEKIGI